MTQQNNWGQLVGLVGNAGVGKDTFAAECAYHHFSLYSFAFPVKEVVKSAFGISDYHITNRDAKETDHPFWGYSPRVMAQKVGTELFRNNFGEDFWLKRLELQLRLDHPTTQEIKAVVTDCRFANEVDFILSKGGKIIYLTRPGHDGNVGITGHASEALATNFLNTDYMQHPDVYHIENNGTVLDLQIKAQRYLNSILLK